MNKQGDKNIIKTRHILSYENINKSHFGPNNLDNSFQKYLKKKHSYNHTKLKECKFFYKQN